MVTGVNRRFLSAFVVLQSVLLVCEKPRGVLAYAFGRIYDSNAVFTNLKSLNVQLN